MSLDSKNRTAICTEEEISAFVHQFYERVRSDDILGPIFNAHIQDWPAHLKLLCDFWSALLLHTGRFEGAPMPAHIALPELRAQWFEHWLSLFAQVLGEQPNQAMARTALEMARRIAQRLWMGYQHAHGLGVQPLRAAAAL